MEPILSQSSSDPSLEDQVTQLKAELQHLKLQLDAEVQERHAVEQAWKTSERRLRQIFEYSNDAIFVIDPKRDCILEANPRAVEMLGYSHEELIHSIQVSTIHPDEIPQLIAFSESVLAKGHGWTNELSCVTKTGHSLWTEISASVIPFEGEDCIITLVRDITERKQAQAAQARLAEIGELAAMIVHEVRTPLTTVLLGLESFRSLDLPERSQLRLAQALDEADRLKRLLSEILQYAREQTLELCDINLCTFVAELQTTMMELPATQGRLIHVELPLTEVWVRGDRNKLKQVFINLIANACEASDKGSRITWCVDQVSRSNQIYISVHNDGNPIPADVLSKLGEPFFTTKPTGNGLGVAIVKRIVEAHGGQFDIQSTPETGTTARVLLPQLLNLKRKQVDGE